MGKKMLRKRVTGPWTPEEKARYEDALRRAEQDIKLHPPKRKTVVRAK